MLKTYKTNPTRPGLSTVGTAHEIVPMVCSWVGVHVSPRQSRTRSRRCQSPCLSLGSITLPTLIASKLEVVELASVEGGHPRPPMWHDPVGFSRIGPIIIHLKLHARLVDAHRLSNHREATLLSRAVRSTMWCKHRSARGTMKSYPSS